MNLNKIWVGLQIGEGDNSPSVIICSFFLWHWGLSLLRLLFVFSKLLGGGSVAILNFQKRLFHVPSVLAPLTRVIFSLIFLLRSSLLLIIVKAAMTSSVFPFLFFFFFEVDKDFLVCQALPCLRRVHSRNIFATCRSGNKISCRYSTRFVFSNV